MQNKWLIIYASILLSTALIGWGSGWTRFVKTGNEAYSHARYDEAHTAFQQATLENTDNPIPPYNLGTALYKKHRFQEATRAFQEALSRHSTQTEDLPHLADIYYNLGNAQFKMGDLRDSIESYKHTLRLNPQDTDAQYNLALAQQLLRQQAEAPQQQPNEKAAHQTEPRKGSEAEALRHLERLSQNENRLRQKLLHKQSKSGPRREKDW